MNRDFTLIFFVIMIAALCGCSEDGYSSMSAALSAETTSQAETESKDVGQAAPVSGGTLRLSMRIPKTFNPLLNEDVTVDNVLKLVFEPLFMIDTDFRVVPSLAQSYKLSDDGKVLTLSLKQGLQWQDGTSITADDIVFSLDTIRTSPNSIYKSALENVSSYSAYDKNTVIINYSQPNGLCMYNLCFPIIPKHYYDKNLSLDSDVNLKPLGSGQYKFSSYEIVKQLTLVKCANFKGEPYIDNILVLITPDKQTDLNAFEQGITDVIVADVSEWGKFNTSKKIDAVQINTNNYEFLGFNFQKPVFTNINIRKAIAYAIPYDDITGNIYLENAVKALTPVNPASWLYCTEDITSYRYDLTKAREYLNQSGMSGINISLLVNTENNERSEAAKLISNALNQIGISVNIVEKSYEEYISLLQSGDFDMFLGGALLLPSSDIRSLFFSASTSNGINYFRYGDSKMDFLLGEAYSAIGEEAYKNAFYEVQRYFAEQMPCIGIGFKNDILLTNHSIMGEKLPTPNNFFNNIGEWYAEEKNND